MERLWGDLPLGGVPGNWWDRCTTWDRLIALVDTFLIVPWWLGIVEHVVGALHRAAGGGNAITKKEEDCNLVLTTSNGQVAIAPMVPPHLNKKIISNISYLLSNLLTLQLRDEL